MDLVKLGVIGGSGLYAMEGLEDVVEQRIPTPFGDPSDAITIASVDGVRVAFLPRHGKGHRILPSEVNSRANVAALKSLGVEQILAFSAVGSLEEAYAPRDFAVPSQVIDRTRHRPDTFFGEGIVGHVAFADPFCMRVGGLAYDAIGDLDVRAHRGGTLVCMEGPLFSTRAESELYRSWGASLINMSAIPEAKLAREAEICYGLICMVTDYDCWHPDHEDVDIQMVIDNLTTNGKNAQTLVRSLARTLTDSERTCTCKDAAQFAVITAPDVRPPETVKKLRGVIRGV